MVLFARSEKADLDAIRNFQDRVPLKVHCAMLDLGAP